MNLQIRPTRLQDGAEAYQLVKSCPGMDLNSLYAYLMLCKEFGETSRIAHNDGKALGYICGIRPPKRLEAVFIWQVVVSPDAQGMGVGGRMLHDLASALAKSSNPVRYVEATVSADNKASRALFGALAQRLDAPFMEEKYLSETDFGGHNHPAEPLIRIGPFA